jgi:hypothetical protein
VQGSRFAQEPYSNSAKVYAPGSTRKDLLTAI